MEGYRGDLQSLQLHLPLQAGSSRGARAPGESRLPAYSAGCGHADPAGMVLVNPPVELLALVEVDAVLRPRR